MRDVERQIEQLLAARKPVLILGEPGAGHDVAARALHAPDTPRVVLPNGARLASNPLAVLEEARDGTLYCSEIGQYAKAEQRGLAFLLPKLDKANVTLVCTSTEPLGNMAAENKFDPALLAALSTGAVLLPPLRARREDIPALIERFWHDVASQEKSAQQPAARGFETLQPAALNMLGSAYWPGNLDHLQSVVANLALFAGSGDITTEHVKRLLGEAAAANQAVAPEITARFFELPLREAREAFERIYFEQLLGREQSNMSRVAERAGLERTHLYRKLKQLSIRFARRGDDGNGGAG
jgi:DNA-binding NtrC family response regulator